MDELLFLWKGEACRAESLESRPSNRRGIPMLVFIYNETKRQEKMVTAVGRDFALAQI